MLVINNPDFFKRAEILWEKGTNRSEFFRGEVNKYGWVDTGSSFLLSELNAALLFSQLEKMEEIMSEVKKGEITRVAFTNEQLHKYFPNSYTPAMMKREILALLKLWKKESWES